jgi:hypothetical protein
MRIATASSAPREDEVARELRALLSGIATDGRITEVIEWSALIARRA